MLSKEGSHLQLSTVKKWQCRAWQEATKASLKKIPNEGYITLLQQACLTWACFNGVIRVKIGATIILTRPKPSLCFVQRKKRTNKYFRISQLSTLQAWRMWRTSCTLPPPPIGSNHRLLKRWSCIDIFPPSVEVPAWRWHQGIFKQTLQHRSSRKICSTDVISCHEWTNHQLVQVFQHRGKIATLRVRWHCWAWNNWVNGVELLNPWIVRWVWWSMTNALTYTPPRKWTCWSMESMVKLPHEPGKPENIG